MATLQERLQIKRGPIDKWSVREQLCLASAVMRSGDQNWMSVSRAIKPFSESNRPPDWFSIKHCAAQYGSLLEHVETPKRKKRVSGSEAVVETPGESILKKLVQERKMELRKKLDEEKREYLKLKDDMDLIKSGLASDVMIDKMCAEIDEEEKQKDQDAIAYSQWLKLREERKLENERVLRPVTKVVATSTSTGLKRKASESLDSVITESSEDSSTQESPSKPASAPLLTSLLKTPSHVPNVTSSILHSAITNQRASPTIASLLNSSASVPVSPSLQQLVSTAISQEPASVSIPTEIIKTANKIEITSVVNTNVEKNDALKLIKDEISLLESSNKTLENTEPVLSKEPIKEEEITIDDSDLKSDSVSIKTEEEVLLSDVEIKIESADPENAIVEEVVQERLDVYDFDNNSKTSSDEIPLKDLISESTNESEVDSKIDAEPSQSEVIKSEPLSPAEPKTKSKETVQSGSVEIVEISVEKDEDSDKETNKKAPETKRDTLRSKTKDESDVVYTTQKEIKPEEKSQKETTVYDEYDFDDIKKPEEKVEEKPPSNLNIDLDAPEFSRKSTFTPEFTETFYDDMSIEVTKLDKSGKAKRDYSRTKKKEEKDIDILLAVEKAVEENNEILEETGSEKDSQDSDKKSDNGKTKLKDTERSNSPWTEEEEAEILPRTRRRLSGTPATPSDSIPNSPASGIGLFDDDRDYRTWKKSVMLVYSRLVAHKCASLFLKPITDEQAPGYHGIIYRPMDLQTIRKNIENGHIRTTAEFQRDVLLMFNNAIMYNQKNEMVYSMAQQMQQEGLQQIQILLQAQTQIETPARRETRTSESGLKRKRGQEDLLKSNKKRRDE